jgi:hypothetical protein
VTKDLISSFGPVTFSIGFLEADLPLVAQAFSSWKMHVLDSVSDVHAYGTFDALVATLAPLTAPPRRSLLIRTRSRWTAYFDNFINGSDAFGPIGHLSSVLGCRGAILTNVPHTLDGDYDHKPGTYGAVQFELYGPEADNPLGCVRSISVAYDGGKWRFDARGAVQQFEEVERYGQRRIVDRFTPAMLIQYALELGIDVFNEDFYAGEARLISYANRASKPARECSFAEARIELGL